MDYLVNIIAKLKNGVMGNFKIPTLLNWESCCHHENKEQNQNKVM